MRRTAYPPLDIDEVSLKAAKDYISYVDRANKASPSFRGDSYSSIRHMFTSDNGVSKEDNYALRQLLWLYEEEKRDPSDYTMEDYNFNDILDEDRDLTDAELNGHPDRVGEDNAGNPNINNNVNNNNNANNANNINNNPRQRNNNRAGLLRFVDIGVMLRIVIGGFIVSQGANSTLQWIFLVLGSIMYYGFETGLTAWVMQKLTAAENNGTGEANQPVGFTSQICHYALGLNRTIPNIPGFAMDFAVFLSTFFLSMFPGWEPN